MTGNDHEGECPYSPEKCQAEAESLKAMREAHIKRVLKMARGDIQAAAKLLEISPPELRRWMTKLGIE